MGFLSVMNWRVYSIMALWIVAGSSHLMLAEFLFLYERLLEEITMRVPFSVSVISVFKREICCRFLILFS